MYSPSRSPTETFRDFSKSHSPCILSEHFGRAMLLVRWQALDWFCQNQNGTLLKYLLFPSWLGNSETLDNTPLWAGICFGEPAYLGLNTLGRHDKDHCFGSNQVILSVLPVPFSFSEFVVVDTKMQARLHLPSELSSWAPLNGVETKFRRMLLSSVSRLHDKCFEKYDISFLLPLKHGFGPFALPAGNICDSLIWHALLCKIFKWSLFQNFL